MAIVSVTIESDVPIPNPWCRKWGLIVPRMKPGDSILVDNRNQSRALMTALSKSGYKSCCRKIDGKGFRIWKLPHKKEIKMKKIGLMILVGILFCFSRMGFCDTPPIHFPTTAENAYLGDQVIVTLINHGTFSEEYRHGQKQMILSDNVVEVGHINGQYILALDASVYQNPLKTHLDYEGGLRLNLHSIVNKYVNLTPQWQAILGNLEYYPRVGFDDGQDKEHNWFATFNLGLGFGPGAGTPNPE